MATPVMLLSRNATGPAVVAWISGKGAVVYTIEHPMLEDGELVDLVFENRDDKDTEGDPITMLVRGRVEHVNGSRSKTAMVTFLDPPFLK